ncbi:MAG: hypothetical protein AAFR76_13925 [Planctomycetota bacterium]
MGKPVVRVTCLRVMNSLLVPVEWHASTRYHTQIAAVLPRWSCAAEMRLTCCRIGVPTSPCIGDFLPFPEATAVDCVNQPVDLLWWIWAVASGMTLEVKGDSGSRADPAECVVADLRGANHFAPSRQDSGYWLTVDSLDCS